MIEIGIDIGGTFTDVVCLIGKERQFTTKVPSSKDVISGVEEGVRRVLDLCAPHLPAGSPIIHIHGTTVATNAILEGKGAVTACLGTAGHEDVIEIGRQKRSRMYDLYLDQETPAFLVPRRLRAGITERIDGAGNVITPLDADQVVRVVGEFKQRYGIESVAVCYLNSYRNPAHERETRQLLKNAFSELAVSLSSEVNPMIREYERACVTVFDAYVRPIVERYLARLAEGLSKGATGGDRELRIMQSRGGITTARMAVRQPVSLVLSGPAGGVVGAKFAAGLSKLDHLITMDIGGTSCDVSLVQGGTIQLTKDGRLRGYPLRFPMVDITTIGSGGGSIAWLDAANGLHVGPRSAGAVPGPACYGRGGDEPTVTDASVVLGYMNPRYFAGGTLPLYPELARRAVGSVAERLKLPIEEMATGIHRILNAQMVEAIKLITVRRGYDPRKFALLAFGGAGAIHAAEVARQLEIREVIIPENPGTLSAFGMLAADVEYDGVSACLFRVNDIDPNELDRRFAELSTNGRERLLAEGIAGVEIIERRSVDMRYIGQSYELEVPFGVSSSAGELPQAVAEFHRRHEEVYGHADRTRPVELVNIRTVHVQRLGMPKLAASANDGKTLAPVEARSAYFHEDGWVKTPVYRRASLPSRTPLAGPAIVEQDDTTVVIYPGQHAILDRAGNLFIRQREGNRG